MRLGRGAGAFWRRLEVLSQVMQGVQAQINFETYDATGGMTGETLNDGRLAPASEPARGSSEARRVHPREGLREG